MEKNVNEYVCVCVCRKRKEKGRKKKLKQTRCISKSCDSLSNSSLYIKRFLSWDSLQSSMALSKNFNFPKIRTMSSILESDDPEIPSVFVNNLRCESIQSKARCIRLRTKKIWQRTSETPDKFNNRNTIYKLYILPQSKQSWNWKAVLMNVGRKHNNVDDNLKYYTIGTIKKKEKE